MAKKKGQNSAGRPSFAEYREDAANWITLAGGEYYPDILPEACELYKPVLVLFGQILKRSESSRALFMNICELRETWMRIQLARVFRKYVSPSTPVEMLKGKSKADAICEQFGANFRPIARVQLAFHSRPIPDEALCALLWEYKDRGKKGYDLTEKFFSLIRRQLPDVTVKGPRAARARTFCSDRSGPTSNARSIRWISSSNGATNCSQLVLLDMTAIVVAHRKTTARVVITVRPPKCSPTP